MRSIIIKHKEKYSKKYRDLKNPERVNAIIPEDILNEDGKMVAIKNGRYYGKKVGKFIYFPFHYALVRIIADDVKEILRTN